MLAMGPCERRAGRRCSACLCRATIIVPGTDSKSRRDIYNVKI